MHRVGELVALHGQFADEFAGPFELLGAFGAAPVQVVALCECRRHGHLELFGESLP